MGFWSSTWRCSLRFTFTSNLCMTFLKVKKSSVCIYPKNMPENNYFEKGEASVHQICHIEEDMAAYHGSPLPNWLSKPFLGINE